VNLQRNVILTGSVLLSATDALLTLLAAPSNGR
jgi:hypothetical protein